jgi:hypothetical protein
LQQLFACNDCTFLDEVHRAALEKKEHARPRRVVPVDAIKAMNANGHESPNAAEAQTTNVCPCCGGRMIIIERFERGATPHYRASPPPAMRIDTS